MGWTSAFGVVSMCGEQSVHEVVWDPDWCSHVSPSTKGPCIKYVCVAFVCVYAKRHNARAFHVTRLTLRVKHVTGNTAENRNILPRSLFVSIDRSEQH